MKIAVCLLLVLGACSELAQPSELSRPQILGLQVSPATLAPGQRGQLSTLVAGPQGRVDAAAAWRLEGPAEVEVEADATYVRIDPAAELDSIVTLYAGFDVGGETLLASRTVSVDATERQNPALDSFTAQGSPVDAAGVVATVGDVVALAIDFDLEPPAQIAWYSTLGEIDIYHRADAELELDEAGTGAIFVVCRDGLGGLSWVERPLSVTP